MKTFTKVTLIFSGIFITLGLIAIVIAVTLGAKFYDAKYYKTIDFSQTYTDIISLNVQLDAGEVVIKEGEEFKVDATGVLKDKFESEVKNGVWTIKEKRNRFFLDFIWEIGSSIHFMNYSPKTTIYVPKDFILDKFDIDIGAGKATVEKLSTKDIIADVGAGDLVINNLISEKSDIDCGVGSISINGVMIGYNKINCGVGEIKIDLSGKETDYNYKYDVGIGSITVNGRAYSTDGRENNDAANDFNIDCGVGSITLNIKE